MNMNEKERVVKSGGAVPPPASGEAPSPSSSSAAATAPKTATEPGDRPVPCRQFMWGKCTKGQSCKFRHQYTIEELKATIKFCHNFQNKGCNSKCSYLHATTDEVELFNETGQLPRVLLERHVTAMAATVAAGNAPVTPGPGLGIRPPPHFPRPRLLPPHFRPPGPPPAMGLYQQQPMMQHGPFPGQQFPQAVPAPPAPPAPQFPHQQLQPSCNSHSFTNPAPACPAPSEFVSMSQPPPAIPPEFTPNRPPPHLTPSMAPVSFPTHSHTNGHTTKSGSSQLEDASCGTKMTRFDHEDGTGSRTPNIMSSSSQQRSYLCENCNDMDERIKQVNKEADELTQKCADEEYFYERLLEINENFARELSSIVGPEVNWRIKQLMMNVQYFQDFLQLNPEVTMDNPQQLFTRLFPSLLTEFQNNSQNRQSQQQESTLASRNRNIMPVPRPERPKNVNNEITLDMSKPPQTTMNNGQQRLGVSGNTNNMSAANNGEVNIQSAHAGQGQSNQASSNNNMYFPVPPNPAFYPAAQQPPQDPHAPHMYQASPGHQPAFPGYQAPGYQQGYFTSFQHTTPHNMYQQRTPFRYPAPAPAPSALSTLPPPFKWSLGLKIC